MLVERRAGDAARRPEVGHRDAVEPARGEQVGRGGQDLLAPGRLGGPGVDPPRLVLANSSGPLDRSPGGDEPVAGQGPAEHRAGEAEQADHQARGAEAGHERVLHRARDAGHLGRRSRRPRRPTLGRLSGRRGSRPSSSSTSRAPYTEEKSEPTTATPRVPPSSRVASLTADPTPARAGGRTCMIDSVAGVEIRPSPRPMSTICGHDRRSRRTRRGAGRDPDERRPKQRQAGGDDGAGADPRGQEAARRRTRPRWRPRPAGSRAGRERVVVADELEVLRDQEDEAEQREEGDRSRRRWPRRSGGRGTGETSSIGCSARALDRDEDREQDGGAGEPSEGLRCWPSRAPAPR